MNDIKHDISFFLNYDLSNVYLLQNILAKILKQTKRYIFKLPRIFDIKVMH